MHGRVGRVALGVAIAATVAGLAAYLLNDGPDSSAAVAKGKPPVVLLMFDEFPSGLLLGPDGKIDAGRYPAFAELARDGYWFPNATSTYDSTTKAIPQVMDGKLPRKGGEPNYVSHPQSVYDLFGRRGYEIVRMESATSICPPRYCHDATLTRPGILTRLQGRRRGDVTRFLASIGPRAEPTFWLGHILLPHGPHLFLPDGKQMRASWQDPIPGMNSTPGFYSKYLAIHAQQRLQLQIGFVDHLLGQLLARLHADGMFDRSLIVVTADHGISSEYDVPSRRNADMRNIDELAPVPLFVKAPHQRHGRTVRSYVRTTDVTPTIADVLHLRMPYRADGRSAFSPTVRKRRTVMMIKRDFSRRFTISASAMERRRAALLRLRLRRLGSGDWDRLYPNVGPHTELVGQQVAALPQAPRDKVGAAIAGGRLMAAVSARSPVLPTEVAGKIRGSHGNATRDLAIAVNGRIEAVGESFHLHLEAGQSARAGESFAVMVPERSMHRGHNVVQVLEVSGGRLRPLGSN